MGAAMLVKTKLIAFFSSLILSNLGLITPAALPRIDVDKILRQSPGLSRNVLELGVKAFSRVHAKGMDTKPVLTIVDYSLPSTQNRLWVIDLRSNQLKYVGLVAHGKNSGVKYAKTFSNRQGSNVSSIGVFMTENSYFGSHGYSLRVNGLEKGFNDQAKTRAIVFHQASYVTPQFAQSHGYLGRSWGCFGLNPKDYKQVINEIKEGSVVLSYYPDHRWLNQSHYV